MANFEARVRLDYRDMTGLVLDCRSDSLGADEGTHDGASNSAVLVDSGAAWAVGSLVGKVVQNVTDGSYGVITANTATTVTATLTGGGDNDWDTGDAYSIAESLLEWRNDAPVARYERPDFAGSHTGSSGVAILIDSSKSWIQDSLIGMVVYNLTDGSLGWVTANTAITATATLSGGTDNDWDNGDAYVIRTPRFGNPYQNTVAKQPVVRTVGGYKLLEFTRSRSHEVKIPLAYGFPPTWWTVGFEFEKGADNSNGQRVFTLLPNIAVDRRDGGGDYLFQHSAVPMIGSGDMPDATWFLQAEVAGTTQVFEDGILDMSGSAGIMAVPAADPAGLIGSANGTWYLDGRVRGLKVWSRPLSDREIDFAFKSFDADGADKSQDGRAAMENRAWTDETGGHARINSSVEAPQRFRVARFPAGGSALVQIAAEVGGRVRPDSELGGKLFELECVEHGSPGPPTVLQDSGWSAVFDVEIDAEGHYTYLLSREQGGGVVLHFDAEEA